MNLLKVHCCTVLLSVILAGCGFELRSYSFSANVASFALTGDTRLAVAEPLRRGLKQAGVTEAPGSAEITVELLDQRRERRAVSTGSGVRAAEYETSYAVRYRVTDAAGTELLAPTWVERARVFRIDRDNIVGSSEEQAILQRELMADIVGQIIRTLDLVSRPAGTA